MKKKLIVNNLFASIFITFLVLLILKYTFAATIYYDGDDVGYDNTASGFKDSNNADIDEVQTALVELNKKARNCSDVALNVGDYFSLTPDVATYTFPKSISGYTSDQTLQIGGSNANYGLRLWRVIDIHCDGSFDAVSEYASHNIVYFRGSTGYKNFVAGLQTIAAQFAKEGYTIDTRMMGYGGQTHSIGDITAFNGSTTNAPSIITSTNPTTGVGMEFDDGVTGDTLYLRDYQLVKNVYGSIGLKAFIVSNTSQYAAYWLASRYYLYNSATSFRFAGRTITNAGALSYGDMRYYSSSWTDKNISAYFRPIITIRSGVGIASGSGTLNSPYTLNKRLDDSGANPPDLVDGLIPVVYDTTNGWVKADTVNENGTYKWYDYDQKKWANAVLVSSTNRTTYMNAAAGTAIPESDALAYYVWIPRFKYKLFNINKVIDSDSYSAETQGIEIIFEKGKTSTGAVSCNYDFSVTEGNGLSETCTGSNGVYYTHPAFTFGTTQLRGIWIGKFEVSSETPDVQTNNNNYFGGGTSTSLTVRIKPNVRSWRYNSVSNFYKVIYDMQTTSNIYGLNTSRSNTDSHMMKNMEWGAIAYLTNSKYGRCSNNTCSEVYINNSSDYITGNAGNSRYDSDAPGTTNAYNTAAGQLASTTGNIYGIYDISGGAGEYVMGNMSSAAGSYTYYPRSAGSNYTYTGNEKYIDTYANGTTVKDQTAYNRTRLGDATGETNGWYADAHDFVNSTNPWIYRGSYYSSGTNAGSYSFGTQYGASNTFCSTRATLVSMQ